MYSGLYKKDMKIQELCKCCKISKRNVYFYIKEGLLEPSCDEQSGRYVFTEADCTKLSLIVCLRNVDMPIPYIRSILNKPVLTSYYLRRLLAAWTFSCKSSQLSRSFQTLSSYAWKRALHPIRQRKQRTPTASTMPYSPTVSS